MLKNIMDIGTLVESGYIDGLPLHIANPARSTFKVMMEEEYQSSSTTEIQNILRTKHILVTDRQKSKHRFDENGLRTLQSNLNDAFTV
jgi:hypothetical protein